MTDTSKSASPSHFLFTFYTTSWCGDCYRLLHHCMSIGLVPGKDYIEIDIDQDHQAAEVVEQLNNGYRSVPTLVFPDGSSLTEPSIRELTDKLNALQKRT